MNVQPKGWEWWSNTRGEHTGAINLTDRNMSIEGIPLRTMVIVSDDEIRIDRFPPSQVAFQELADAMIRNPAFSRQDLERGTFVEPQK